MEGGRGERKGYGGKQKGRRRIDGKRKDEWREMGWEGER